MPADLEFGLVVRRISVSGTVDQPELSSIGRRGAVDVDG